MKPQQIQAFANSNSHHANSTAATGNLPNPASNPVLRRRQIPIMHKKSLTTGGNTPSEMMHGGIAKAESRLPYLVINERDNDHDSSEMEIQKEEKAFNEQQRGIIRYNNNIRLYTTSNSIL